MRGEQSYVAQVTSDVNDSVDGGRIAAGKVGGATQTLQVVSIVLTAGEAQAAAMRPDRMDDRPPARPRSASTPRMSERRSSEKSANRSYNL